MSSSEVQQSRPRRRWRWLVIVLILLAAGYSAAWFYAARKIEQQVDQAAFRLGERGIRFDCGDRQVVGFPLSLTLSCDGIAYDDPKRNLRAATGALDAQAALFQPLTPVAQLQGPLDLPGVPGLPDLRLKAEWRSLQANAHLWWPTPSQISVESTDVAATMTTLMDPTEKKVFSASAIAAHVMPDGADLTYKRKLHRSRHRPGSRRGPDAARARWQCRHSPRQWPCPAQAAAKEPARPVRRNPQFVA